MVRVLVVEDEANIREMIALNLRLTGMEAVEAESAEAALPLLAKKPGCDAAILDVMLPDLDGFTLCQKIREAHLFPILMLTARVEDMDKIMGLTLGADDYLTKPFSPQELVLRVYAVLRRCYPETSTKLALAHCVIDFDAIEVVREDETKTNLTAKELTLLTILSHNPNRIVTTDRLCEECWGSSFGYEQSLMTHIRRIREKIEKDPSNPESLITMKGLGYKLMVDPSKQ